MSLASQGGEKNIPHTCCLSERKPRFLAARRQGLTELTCCFNLHCVNTHRNKYLISHLVPYSILTQHFIYNDLLNLWVDWDGCGSGHSSTSGLLDPQAYKLKFTPRCQFYRREHMKAWGQSKYHVWASHWLNAKSNGRATKLLTKRKRRRANLMQKENMMVCC